MTKTFDAIVVGARCAGSPTAMLLARKGYRVLVVDRATFPSDTVSTHILHPRSIDALARWGLLDRVIATGCPPVHTYTYDFGPFTIEGAPGTDEMPLAYCPRRTVLDKLLVDAASEAGAEVREGFTVEKILIEDGRVVRHRRPVEARRIRCRARKNRHRRRWKTVDRGGDGAAATYNEKPPLLAAYYTYWSGLPMNGRFETFIRERRGFAAVPTNDGLTMVIVGWPYAEFAENKKDIEGNYLKTIAMAPAFDERLRSAKREAQFVGAAVPNYFRKPYGPGWALIGDAGYNKDFITAQGILDAFRDAELCADALDASFSGARTFEDAMRDYQRKRDADVLPIYELTCELATLEPPPPEMQRLLAAIHGNQKAMDGFVQASAGTISPAEFFAPQNAAAILAAAA